MRRTDKQKAAAKTIGQMAATQAQKAAAKASGQMATSATQKAAAKTIGQKAATSEQKSGAKRIGQQIGQQAAIANQKTAVAASNRKRRRDKMKTESCEESAPSVLFQ